MYIRASMVNCKRTIEDKNTMVHTEHNKFVIKLHFKNIITNVFHLNHYA